MEKVSVEGIGLSLPPPRFIFFRPSLFPVSSLLKLPSYRGQRAKEKGVSNWPHPWRVFHPHSAHARSNREKTRRGGDAQVRGEIADEACIWLVFKTSTSFISFRFISGGDIYPREGNFSKLTSATARSDSSVTRLYSRRSPFVFERGWGMCFRFDSLASRTADVHFEPRREDVVRETTDISRNLG